MPHSLRVVALTGKRSDPSGRFRIAAYAGPLKSMGIRLIVRPSKISKYPPVEKWLRPLWLPAAVASRAPDAFSTWASDVTLLSREMISTLETWEPLTKRPRILDIDDAIWLHQRGHSVASLARRVESVIAGNDFLADWLSRFNRNVTILPTPVDTSLFRPASSGRAAGNDPELRREPQPLMIGWQGTSSNLKYLYMIEGALAAILKKYQGARVRVVCDRPPRFSSLPADRIEFIRWSEQNEVIAMQGTSVGLMPLDDSDWSRGKCGYKMLLYLACGIPAVVSPVGMNAQVLSRTDAAMAAASLADWENCLDHLLASPALRSEMGSRGRRFVEAEFSLTGLAPRMADILRRAAGADR